MKKIFILLSVLSVFLSSCEKEIQLELPPTEPMFVVEGAIEPGQKPYVILTKSMGYFDPIDSASIAKSIILDAIVVISNGATTDTMKLAFNPQLYIPVVYQSSSMLGEVGKTYSLKIIAQGKTITSQTTIPAPIHLDSIWYKDYPPNDTLGYIWAHLTDPSGKGNAYRWMAKRLHRDKRFLPPPGSVFNDDFIDGKSFDFAYNRGEEPNSNLDEDTGIEAGYFRQGDTIVIKFSTIDENIFQFYRTYETDKSNNGNPFASPLTIKTNIIGGVGCWAGFGAVYDTVVAK